MSERFRLRGSGLEWRKVEDEVVALDMRTETYLGLNRAGAVVWQSLADGTTHAELTQRLIDEYGVDRSVAESDVTRFIAALEEHSLVESIEE